MDRFRSKIQALHSGVAPEKIRHSQSQIIQVTISTAGIGFGLGDYICALIAARNYARHFPNQKVYFPALPDFIKAYGDKLVEFGTSGTTIFPDTFTSWPLLGSNTFVHQDDHLWYRADSVEAYERLAIQLGLPYNRDQFRLDKNTEGHWF